MNSNAVNNAFSNEAVLCADRLSQRMPKMGTVPAKVLVERTVQKVLDLGRLPYAKLALDGQLKHGTIVDFGRCALESGTGRLLLSKKQWIQGVAEFLVHWCYCFISLLAVRFASRQMQGVVLAFGISTESIFVAGQDAEFADYCRQTPVLPLRDAKYLYIQSTVSAGTSTDPRITYVPRPLIELVRRGKLGGVARMRAVTAHVLGLVEFLMAACRCTEVALLGRDFAYVKVVVALDSSQLLQAVVTTCSSVAEQPLWGRCLTNAKVHMVWYAQNWRPVVFKADGVESEIPFMAWLRVDVNWVWTHKFAEYLHRLVGGGATYAVGPIVWRNHDLTRHEKKSFQIAVFDVSPYSDETALSYCEYPNYNHPSNLIKFVEDIIELRSIWQRLVNSRVVLRLKTKRGYLTAYDRSYFNLLEKLHAEGEIELEHHTANIFDLISSGQAVIAYPFTSPPYLADAVFVPSIYYDPTCGIMEQNFADEQTYIQFASGKEQLNSKMIRLMCGKTEHARH
jgi:hypothetical protein